MGELLWSLPPRVSRNVPEGSARLWLPSASHAVAKRHSDGDTLVPVRPGTGRSQLAHACGLQTPRSGTPVPHPCPAPGAAADRRLTSVCTRVHADAGSATAATALTPFSPGSAEEGGRPGVAPGRGRSTARRFPVRRAEPVVARPAAASSAALGSARPARRHAAPHAPPVPAASEQATQTGGRSTFRKRSGFRSRRGSSPSGWKAVSPSVGAGVPSDAPAGRQTCSSRACGSFPAPFSRLPPPPARLSQTRGGHRSPRLLEAEPESVGYGVRPCPPGSS